MYLVCKNPFRDIVNETAKPDFNIKFGNSCFPVSKANLLFVAHSIDSSKGSIECSSCSSAVAKSIADFTYGKEIFITFNSIEEMKHAALEIGILEIIESCEIFGEADKKIKEIIKNIQDPKTEKSRLLTLEKIVARYFNIFTMYSQFKNLPCNIMKEIFENADVLGINSEYSFLYFIYEYKTVMIAKNPTDVSPYELFKFVRTSLISKLELMKFSNTHKDEYQFLQLGCIKETKRVYVSNLGKDLRIPLAQILSEPV